jgi:putative transposase
LPSGDLTVPVSYGINTDRGSQYTSETFTDMLDAQGVKISMDGKGRWIDNVFIERLWRSVKYEEVYLKAYGSMAEARKGLGTYFEFYYGRRRYQTLSRRTPNEIYWATLAVDISA